MECVRGTSIEGLVTEEDRYSKTPDELPDKFAVFAPDHHELGLYTEIS